MAREWLLYFARLDFRYLAIEGPIGLGQNHAGRTARRAARRRGRPGRAARIRSSPISTPAASGAAFQAQLFFTLARHRQLQRLRQGDLFSQTTICDYIFERDRIYAFMNLDDNELFIYQRLFDLRRRATSRCPTSSSICRRRPTC